MGSARSASLLCERLAGAAAGTPWQAWQSPISAGATAAAGLGGGRQRAGRGAKHSPSPAASPWLSSVKAGAGGSWARRSLRSCCGVHTSPKDTCCEGSPKKSPGSSQQEFCQGVGIPLPAVRRRKRHHSPEGPACAQLAFPWLQKEVKEPALGVLFITKSLFSVTCPL